MKKSIITLITVALMMVTMGITSWAGEWIQDTAGWWYQEDNGSYRQINGKK